MKRYDPLDLAGQEARERDEVALARVKRQRELEDIKWLMSSRQGRRIMWRLLDLTGPTRSSFDTNALRMAWNEGNRNFGVQMLEEVLRYCSETYRVMVKEHNDDNRDDGAKSK
jgi:hypothetical protein